MAISGSGKSPLSSQIIGGRYRVECCIASGAEANVVGAVDCATGKRVALKCWDGPTSEQEVAAIQCFVRSANVSGLFENPHIVEVYGTELGDTVSYSVSEWLEGSTLAREAQRLGRLPLQETLQHVLPCLRAIAEAHAAGIVHGDIRPAHIFLCRAKRHLQERARLFDFGRGLPGFSELRLPARGVVDELCRYTPPELLSGGVLDARSDIYGFGLLLYEVTTGERMFKSDDLRDLLREIENGPTRALNDVTQTLPRGFVEVLYRAMAVDPEQRYQEVAPLLDALTVFARRNTVQPTAAVSAAAAGSSELTRAYPSHGPWESTPFPMPPQTQAQTQAQETTEPKRPSARVTLSRIQPFRDLDEKIIIPRRKPVWQVAAVAAFLGISYLALDQGVRSSPGSHAPAGPVTSHSAASDSQRVEAAPTAAPPAAANVFEPLPVPSVYTYHLREREAEESTRLTSVASAGTSRRSRRAERRRAARAAEEASKRGGDDEEADNREIETPRRAAIPVIDETIPTPPLERMELQ